MAEGPAQPVHPKYSEMITAAIKTLKDRKGSSRQAIVKYIRENYTVSDNCEGCVTRALSKNTEGLWINTKGSGAVGSFKLNPEKVMKKPAKAKEAKDDTKPKKTTTKAVSFDEGDVEKKPKATKKSTATTKKPVSKKGESNAKESKTSKSTAAPAKKEKEIANSLKKPKAKTIKPKTTKETKKPATKKATGKGTAE